MSKANITNNDKDYRRTQNRKNSDSLRKKVYVLHVAGKLNRGGTESLLVNILHTIDRTKYQLDFVEQTDESCDFDNEILGLGSKIYRSPHITLLKLHAYRMWWRNFFKEHPEYKIVHGHSSGSAPVYLDEAKKAGRITIMHCHSNSYGKGIKGLIRCIWQLPLRKMAHYNLACSYEAGRIQFGRHGRFKVIKNGIITSKYAWNPEFRKLIREEYRFHDKFVIGNVARFDEAKNHTFIIEIFNEIQKRYPNSVLLLVGEGLLEERIKKLVSDLKLEKKVIFAGVRSDVEVFLQAMDAFLLPSLYEGLPLSLVEAQVAGLPCYVSADVISSEADITELVDRISLELPAETWAIQILEHRTDNRDRASYIRQIQDAGYDIETTTKWLSKFYKTLYIS